MDELNKLFSSNKDTTNLTSKKQSSVNDLKENSFKIMIVELIIKYIYEFGPLEVKKYALEYELTKTNRSLELLSESLSEGLKIDVNYIFQVTNEEFYSIGVLADYIKDKINDIHKNIENNETLKDAEELMQNIYKIISTLHPDSKSKLNTWSKIDWKDEYVENSRSYKSMVENNLNTNKGDLYSLEEYLPVNVIESVKDNKLINSKKTELNQTIHDLESIKSELEQLFLALLPIEENYTN